MSEVKDKRQRTRAKANRKDWRTERRQRAWTLYKQGWKKVTIARALGVSQAAVSQWLKVAQTLGRAALEGRPRPGRPPKLTPAQRQKLLGHLAASPSAHGFRGEVWTCARIKVVIHQQFQIEYSVSQVSRILKQLNWTRQKPIRRQRVRSEAAIAHWRRYKWPELKKRLKKRAIRSSV